MKNILKSIIIIAGLAIAAPHAQAQVSVGVGLSVHIGPPELPVYDQPICPGDGYLWTPGYWAYGDNGYYWVPGVWVRPPHYGLLWTPAYWGYDGGVYVFHAGYWGPHVGFYGGINYGFGYGGVGFGGGMWVGHSFRYNTAVAHVNTTIIHNTYVNRTVINNNHSRVSFNGRGGVDARPSAADQRYARENHIRPTSQQMSHQQSASRNRSQFGAANHGRSGNQRATGFGHTTAENHRAGNQQGRQNRSMQTARQNPGGNRNSAGHSNNHMTSARSFTRTANHGQQMNRSFAGSRPMGGGARMAQSHPQSHGGGGGHGRHR